MPNFEKVKVSLVDSGVDRTWEILLLVYGMAFGVSCLLLGWVTGLCLYRREARDLHAMEEIFRLCKAEAKKE